MSATWKLGVALDRAEAERLADALGEAEDLAADAVTHFESAPDSEVWRVEAYFQTAPEASLVAAIARDALGHAPGFDIEELAETDWVAHVERTLAPVIAGRFLVHGSHDRARARGTPHAIEIDAGRAFGTAHHGTTRGCLIALEKLARRHRFDAVLDLGTGSGVLAIAAAKLLRQPVLATDIDPVSVATALENAGKNGVGGLVEAIVAEGLAHPAIRAAAPFGLVLANILLGPLLTLAPAMARAVGGGGHIVLSGITAGQRRRLTARYGAAGFVQEDTMTLAGWSTVTMRRRG